MAPPDLTLLFSGEVAEWDNYLTRQFESSCDSTPTVIEHEQIEEISFPICTSQSRHFTDARAVLVILSPSFLDFLDRHADEGFQIGKLLKPSRTVAMLCGVQPSDVSSFHKAALVTYGDWPHIVARDKDVNMVRSVVETVQDLLTRSKENERIHKPKFKLIPRKVNEGNGKVFVILNKPLEDTKKVKITLEGHGVKEVPVKRRNPYTLQFVVPDICMQVLSVLNVHVRCNDDLLGVSQLKCESRMGELYNLLSSINSPYEFICHTLGMATLHEVDEHMVAAFRKNLPPSGFSLLHVEEKSEKKKSKDEFPTLLHFGARYGLCNLCNELLRCPGSETASSLKNSRGLTPAQMANHAGHNDIANILEHFQKSFTASEKPKSTQVVQSATVVYEQMQVESAAENYDIPPLNPARVVLPPNSTSEEEEEAVLGKECEYLKMMGTSPNDLETFEPHKKLILGFDCKRDESEEILLSSLSGERPASPQRISQGDKAKLALLESQAKLIEIMEAYKKGASLIEVEKLHNEWKAMYQVSDAEAKSTLEGLRGMYAKAQKAKINKKQSSSFSELRQFFGSKLRRKDSVGSKSNSSRKSSKDMNCIEKLCLEVEGLRPVSTLSIMSNTSSSSGSSFDRLSSVSGGSDSGNHSDYGEEANRLREAGKFESRFPHPAGLNGSLLISQPGSIPLPLNSKPPAPPPRPVKPPSFINKYENRIYSNSLDNTAYSVPHKFSPSSCTSPEKSLDYVMPDCTLEKGNAVSFKKSAISKSADDLLIVPPGDCKISDPCDLYDTPPPAGNLLKQQALSVTNDMPKLPTSPIHTCGLSFINAAKNESYGMDYDMVPPPLPVSVPPRKPSFPKFERSSSLSNYDIPKFPPPTPTSKEILEANYDFPRLDQNSLCSCLLKPRKDSLPPCCCSASSYDVPLSPRKYSLPNTPLSDTHSQKSLSPYYNLHFARNSCSSDDQCDSIPDEPPPPPPQELNDEEEHYKLVGVPVPVSGAYLTNIASKC